MRKSLSPIQIRLHKAAMDDNALQNALIATAKEFGYAMDYISDTLPGIFPRERLIEFRKEYRTDKP